MEDAAAEDAAVEDAAVEDAAAEDAAAEDAAPPVVGGAASDWRDVYLHARALHEQAGAPLLLASRGDVARAAARRAAGLFAPGEVRLRALPTQGDPAAEIALALAAEGLACAAVVEARAPDLWVAPEGDCQPAAAAEVPAGPPKLAIGARHGDPSWRVRTEEGEPVDAWRYAALTRDEDLRDRLVTERRRHRVGRTALAATGVALVAGAVAPLAASLLTEGPIAEDRRFTALFMTVTGGTLVLGARLDRQGLEARQREVGRYLHPADAADAVADHNDRVERAQAPPEAPASPPAAPPAAPPAEAGP